MAESLRRSLEQIRLNEDLHKAKTLLSEESERFDKANLEISQLYELIRERDKAPEERRPNIELKAVQFPNVIYDRDAGVWHDRLEDRATDYKACVLIFQNNTYSDGKGVDAIDLRAQITWVYDNDSPGPFFSPAAWLDEEYGQINKFPVGWTKKLLIGIRGSEYWDGYDNRRMDASEGRQTHGEMVPFDGTMTVKLIDHTGQSLYEAKWKWEENINTHWPHLRGPFPVDAKIG